MAYQTRRGDKPHIQVKNIAAHVESLCKRACASFVFKGKEGKGYYVVKNELIPADIFEAQNPIIALEKITPNTLDGRSNFY